LGDVIDGYLIEAEIQINARSHVYKVRDKRDNSFIVKNALPNLADDIDALQAFQREEWIGQRFHHPDIVKTCTKTSTTSLFIFNSRILRRPKFTHMAQTSPTCPRRNRFNFAKPAIKALRALHRRETLHQDIKPDNLFLTSTGQLKLIDFGSATVGSL
jgi:serine/threonine protein kinase